MASHEERVSAAERQGLPVLEDLPELVGKRVFVRADLNVPLRAVGGRVEVADDYRLRASLPTLRWLIARGAHVTVGSHLGRPKGVVVPELSIAPVRALLDELLPSAAVLENLRFDPGEEANDPAFTARLIADQDYYVDDAFGAAHRTHASIVGPPEHLPSAGGRLLAHEVEMLSPLLASPARPFVAVVGGAKVSDKLGVLEALTQRVDTLIVGGAMCFTFLAAQGLPVGASLVEPQYLEACRAVLDSDREVLLPLDVVGLSPGGEPGHDRAGTGHAWTWSELPNRWTGVDIGPASAERFAEVISSAGTVLWNGPMGVVEDPRFVEGTLAVARAIAGSRAYRVAAGGDTAAVVRHLGLVDRFDHVSSGGGAALEFLEKGDLPGLAALRAAAARTQAPAHATSR